MGGYGGRFSQWVQSDNPQPYNSFGNGAAMRVSPVAYCYEDESQILNAAEATAACSHNHPEGIKGAKTVAMAIYTARELHQGCDVLGEKEIDYILSQCTAVSNYDIEIEIDGVINKFDETCQGTVPVALWIIGESTSFEDAVRKAVSLGADADTLGAIVGSIAEAIWGIPIDMQIQAMNYLPSDMKRVVLQFYRRYIKDSFLAGYDDEGAAIDLLPEE
jgi:ADP-ribosylglycohydrolase